MPWMGKSFHNYEIIKIKVKNNLIDYETACIFQQIRKSLSAQICLPEGRYAGSAGIKKLLFLRKPFS
jgi:hypothetical protein